MNLVRKGGIGAGKKKNRKKEKSEHGMSLNDTREKLYELCREYLRSKEGRPSEQYPTASRLGWIDEHTLSSEFARHKERNEQNL